eukprot:11310525-Prorocentrum_lima.AAC.1
MVSEHYGVPFQGLQQAARCAKKRDGLANHLVRSMAQLDVVSGFIRHISAPKAVALVQEIRWALCRAALQPDTD